MSIWRLEDGMELKIQKKLFGSGDVGEVGAGVVAVLKCIRAFRFYQKADVLPNIQVIATLFPTLVTIADGMLNTFPSQPASQEIPAMLHLIPQTYKTAIKYRMAIPIEGVPTDEEDREKCEWWKAKKWAYGILNQLFHHIKPKSTWILLKPQFTFKASKQAMWEADPVEYVRASVDEYENFLSPVSGATSFLLSLASNRTKHPSSQCFSSSTLSCDSQRIGALTMMSVLGPFIVRHPDVKGSIEQFMVQYVLPEFTLQELYLRSVVCLFISLELLELMWFKHASISTTSVVFALNLNSHSSAVALAIDDRELLVRVQAALAITKLLVVHNSDLLKLSDEMDLNILNHSMEAMVDQFQNELPPMASQLTARLCESYLCLAREGLAQQKEAALDSIDVESLMMDGDDDKVYGAMGVAKTIRTVHVLLPSHLFGVSHRDAQVVSCIDSSPEILLQVQEVIIPIIRFTLENKLIGASPFSVA
ncbi:hypothetical protein BD769DRAFT_1737516 [Suillus cothurnatus]|nr:hypothetical protein BD769DRAFT_1737516 [Suillus cothurnatus]